MFIYGQFNNYDYNGIKINDIVSISYIKESFNNGNGFFVGNEIVFYNYF